MVFIRRGLMMNTDKSNMMVILRGKDSGCEARIDRRPFDYISEFLYLELVSDDIGTD